MAHQNPNKIDTLVIHCAATPNGRSFTATDINDWHRERGFKRTPNQIGYHAPHLKHIGYHFVIPLNGAVEVGRSLSETGAHAQGYNRNSIGTSLIGTDEFTLEQWESLMIHVRSLSIKIPTLKKIIGHNEINSHKTCPGFDVQAWLKGKMVPLDGHILEAN